MAKTVTIKVPRLAHSAQAFVEAGGRTSGATQAPVPSMPKVRITVDFPQADHKAFKVAASHEGRNMGDIVRDLVGEWLARR